MNLSFSIRIANKTHLVPTVKKLLRDLIVKIKELLSI